MPDYGHDLEFGVFLSPDANAAARTLELAQLAEVLGYDLVTMQDHPYQARHLDAWTLLSAIAARTSAVRVAPNVANLPLRPPAVLAQAVASLDILSDGRAELGLGAGAFWDAVVAAGGPRRSPGEAVEALEEAIAIIRGVWGVDGHRTVDVDGEYYRVKGMHAGPLPVHDIAIWVGALKPRMLRLTGRLADGWLPSLGRVTPDTIAEMNAVIDEAAEKAGRARRRCGGCSTSSAGHEQLRGDPRCGRAARRLHPRPGHQHVHPRHDDPDELRRFAAEVAPPSGSSWTPNAAQRPPPAARWSSRGERQRAARRDPAPDRATQLRPPRPRTTAPASRRRCPGTRPPARRTPAPDDGRTSNAGVPQHLIDVHDHLRTELATVRDLVDQVRRGPLDRRRRTVGDQHDDDAPEQLDPRRVLRVLLPDRHRPPHARGPAASSRTCASAEPGLGAVVDRLQEEHVVIHDVLEQVDDAPGRARRRPVVRRRRQLRSTSCNAASTCSPTRCCRTCPTRSAS